MGKSKGKRKTKKPSENDKLGLFDPPPTTPSCRETVQAKNTKSSKKIPSIPSIPSEAYLQPQAAKNKMKLKDCDFLLNYIGQHTYRLITNLDKVDADIGAAINEMQNLRKNLVEMMLKADMSLDQHISGVMKLKILDMQLAKSMREQGEIVEIKKEMKEHIENQKSLEENKPSPAQLPTEESKRLEERRKWKQCRFSESDASADGNDDTLMCTVVAQDEQITKTESVSEDVQQKSSSEVDNTQNQNLNLETPSEENRQRTQWPQCQFDETSVLVDNSSDTVKSTPVSHEPQITDKTITEDINETVCQKSLCEKDESENGKVLSDLSSTMPVLELPVINKNLEIPVEVKCSQLECQVSKMMPLIKSTSEAKTIILRRRKPIILRRKKPIVKSVNGDEDVCQKSLCEMNDLKNEKTLTEFSSAMNLHTPIEVKMKDEQFSDKIDGKFNNTSLNEAKLEEQIPKGNNNNNNTRLSQKCVAYMKEVMEELFGDNKIPAREKSELNHPNNNNNDKLNGILLKRNAELLQEIKMLKENQKSLNKQLTDIFASNNNLQSPAVQPTLASTLPSGGIFTVSDVQKSSESTIRGDQQLTAEFKIDDKETQGKHLIKIENQETFGTSFAENNNKNCFDFSKWSSDLNFACNNAMKEIFSNNNMKKVRIPIPKNRPAIGKTIRMREIK